MHFLDCFLTLRSQDLKSPFQYFTVMCNGRTIDKPTIKIVLILTVLKLKAGYRVIFCQNEGWLSPLFNPFLLTQILT